MSAKIVQLKRINIRRMFELNLSIESVDAIKRIQSRWDINERVNLDISSGESSKRSTAVSQVCKKLSGQS